MEHQHLVSNYMEHGFCFAWEPGLVWLHVASDIITGIAYYSITIALFYFIYKRRDLPFYGIFLLFGIFIIACGSTHLFAAYTVFVPAYWYEGAVKAFTAVVSAISAVIFIPQIPNAIAMPSLSTALAENKKLNEQLSSNLEELEERSQELQKSHNLLDNISSQVAGVIYQYRRYPDDRSHFSYVSEGVNEVFELTADEVREDASALFSRIHPDDYDRFKDAMEESARAMEPGSVEFRVVLPWQGTCWRMANARPQSQEDGSIVWHGFITDITARKTAEESLLHAKELTENIIQSANVLIVGLDGTGTIILFNRTAEEVIGYTLAEIEQKGFDLFIPPAILPEVRAEFKRLMHGGEPSTFENQILTKTGGVKTISWRNNPIVENGKVVGTISFGIDITEHRKLEEQLRQSLKMESIGLLAGGVAHDFNNKLTVILGYAEMSRLNLHEGDPLRQNLDEIIKAAEHSRDITRQLLAFSRQQIISPKPIDLNTVINETKRTLSHLIGEDIILSFTPGENLWMVKLDPAQLDQIVMNLAVNARDAMPNGGHLEIATTNTYIDETYCQEYLYAKPGEYVQLTFSDTGSGMDRETLKHIFEPFFTTKEIGKGTGLGLATIYGIVRQNNGFVNVYSEPGHGTMFKIFLPRLMEGAGTESRLVGEPVKGTGSILLVEDEDAVRLMTVRMLEKIGYTVHPAATPREALDICADDSVRIDMVVSDVIMPGMSGKDMMDRIEKVRPGTKVLYMSGYTSDTITQKGVLEEGMHFIQKPFDMNSLNQKIKETLG